MKLIVGLGNPGAKYQNTRHNVGFLAIDALGVNESDFKLQHKALSCKTNICGKQVILAKPQTYMNLSGESVQATLSYYKLKASDLLVLVDDIKRRISEFDARILFCEIDGGWDGLVLHGQQDLDQTGDPRRRLQVANIRLDRT